LSRFARYNETYADLHLKGTFFPFNHFFIFSTGFQENPKQISRRIVRWKLHWHFRETVRQASMMKVSDAIRSNTYVKLFAVSGSLNMEGHELVGCRWLNCEWIRSVLFADSEFPYSNSSNRSILRKIVQNIWEDTKSFFKVRLHKCNYCLLYPNYKLYNPNLKYWLQYPSVWTSCGFT